MKFKLIKASDWEFCKEVEINTLDDLKKIFEESNKEPRKFEKFNHDQLIIDFEPLENPKLPIIEIYDTYVE